jgi:hypothetical protein
MKTLLEIEESLLPSAQSRTFSLPGKNFSARLLSNREHCLTLADYHLQPFFASANGGKIDWEIRTWLAGQAWRPLSEPSREARFMDHQSHIWELPEGGKVILEKESGAGFWCRGKTISVYPPDESPENCRQAARMVREFIAQSAAKENFLRLHAAAVTDHAGRGLLILGTKGAGKTSLMLSLIREGVSRFCANDRLLLSCNNSSPEALGLPNSVRLDLRALKQFPQFEQLPSRRMVSSREGELKVAFAPQELCRALGAEIISRTEVHAVLAPELRSERRTVETRQVPREERAALLDACLLPADETFLAMAGNGSATWSKDRSGYQSLLTLPWLRVTAPPGHPDLAEKTLKRIEENSLGEVSAGYKRQASANIGAG